MFYSIITNINILWIISILIPCLMLFISYKQYILNNKKSLLVKMSLISHKAYKTLCEMQAMQLENSTTGYYIFIELVNNGKLLVIPQLIFADKEVISAITSNNDFGYKLLTGESYTSIIPINQDQMNKICSAKKLYIYDKTETRYKLHKTKFNKLINDIKNIKS